MPRPLQKLQRFFAELKRRNVYRVAATYAGVAFIGFQAIKLLIPSTTLPTWAAELILSFLIVGFPVSLVFAWAFEMTPEGVRRTEALEVLTDAYFWAGPSLAHANVTTGGKGADRRGALRK